MAVRTPNWMIGAVGSRRAHPAGPAGHRALRLGVEVARSHGATTTRSARNGQAVGVIDRLALIVRASNRQFPGGADPFKMITRLAEECGELAAEVQHWERQGVKVQKHGEPDVAKTAKEVMDVITAALTIAEHYGLVDDVRARIEVAISQYAAAEFLTSEEARAAD